MHQCDDLEVSAAVGLLVCFLEAIPELVDDKVERLELGSDDLPQQSEGTLALEGSKLVHPYQLGNDISRNIVQSQESRERMRKVCFQILVHVHEHVLLQLLQILCWNGFAFVNRDLGPTHQLNEQVRLHHIEAGLRVQAALDDLRLEVLDLVVEASYLLLRFGVALVALLESAQPVPLGAELSEEEKVLRSVQLVLVVVDELFDLFEGAELQIVLLELLRDLRLIHELEKPLTGNGDGPLVEDFRGGCGNVACAAFNLLREEAPTKLHQLRRPDLIPLHLQDIHGPANHDGSGDGPLHDHQPTLPRQCSS